MTTMIPNLFLLVKMNHIHLLGRANLILKPFSLSKQNNFVVVKFWVVPFHD